jgi:multisubunit Na+/H+ antiporter MnhB subunit
MPLGRRKGQAQLFGGMVACAAMVILKRLDLDFLAGVCLGVSLGLFFLGFRAFHRS